MSAWVTEAEHAIEVLEADREMLSARPECTALALVVAGRISAIKAIVTKHGAHDVAASAFAVLSEARDAVRAAELAMGKAQTREDYDRLRADLDWARQRLGLVESEHRQISSRVHDPRDEVRAIRNAHVEPRDAAKRAVCGLTASWAQGWPIRDEEITRSPLSEESAVWEACWTARALAAPILEDGMIGKSAEARARADGRLDSLRAVFDRRHRLVLAPRVAAHDNRCNSPNETRESNMIDGGAP